MFSLFVLLSFYPSPFSLSRSCILLHSQNGKHASSFISFPLFLPRHNPPLCHPSFSFSLTLLDLSPFYSLAFDSNKSYSLSVYALSLRPSILPPLSPSVQACVSLLSPSIQACLSSISLNPTLLLPSLSLHSSPCLSSLSLYPTLFFFSSDQYVFCIHYLTQKEKIHHPLSY